MDTPTSEAPHLTLVAAPDLRPLSADETALTEEMIGAYTAYMQGGGLRKSTVRDNVKQIRDLVAYTGKPPWHWDEHDFEQWSANLARLAKASQRKHQSAIRQFLQWLLESPRFPHVVRVQFGGVLRQIVTKRNAIPHILERDHTRPTPGFEHDQLHTLFSTLSAMRDEAVRFGTKSLPIILRDIVLFSLCYSFGLRTEELLSLTIHSFQPDSRYPSRGRYGCVEVGGKAPRGQAKKWRTIPCLLPGIQPLMNDYLAHVRPVFLAKAKQDKDRLFLSERGLPLTKAAFFYRFQLVMINAGLSGRYLSPHSLRRAYATHLLESGVPLATVSAYLGHANLSTTQKYIRLGDQYVDQETEKLLRRIDQTTNAHR